MWGSSPPQSVSDPVAAGEKLGANIERDEDGYISSIYIKGRQVSDAGLVHQQGLTNLFLVTLTNTRINDAGPVHLSGLPNLVTFSFDPTQVSDAGWSISTGRRS